MLFQKIEEKYGRPFLIAAVILIWLLIGYSFLNYGYIKTWKLWHIPALLPPFLDFRLIPGSAETFRMGIDPALDNPGDPAHRIFNYPKIWTLFFYTGITEDDTIWVSITMLILFFLSVMFLPGKLRIRDAIIMLFVIFAPASMLLYERGNVDLIIFAICASAVMASESFPGLTTGILAFGAVVKMFPFFGLSVLLKKSQGTFFRAFLIVFAILVAYMILTFDSVIGSWTLTMRGVDNSYGANVFFDQFAPLINQYLPRFFSKVLPIFLALILFILCFLKGCKTVERPPVLSQRNLDSFRMGASIFAGTFLLGNNWDYRLAFLIFLVPQLSQWIQLPLNKHRLASLIALTTAILSGWYMLIKFYMERELGDQFFKTIFIMDELINWLLAATLMYLLAASAPDWLRKFDLRQLLRPAELFRNDLSF